MLDYAEIPRVSGHGREDVVQEIMDAGRPVIVDETDCATLRRVIAEWGEDKLASVFGDQRVKVRYFEEGKFDMNVPFALQTTELPASEFIRTLKDLGDDAKYYMRITTGFEDERRLGGSLFDDLEELSRELTVCRCVGRPLDGLELVKPCASRRVVPDLSRYRLRQQEEPRGEVVELGAPQNGQGFQIFLMGSVVEKTDCGAATGGAVGPQVVTATQGPDGELADQ